MLHILDPDLTPLGSASPPGTQTPPLWGRAARICVHRELVGLPALPWPGFRVQPHRDLWLPAPSSLLPERRKGSVRVFQPWSSSRAPLELLSPGGALASGSVFYGAVDGTQLPVLVTQTPPRWPKPCAPLLVPMVRPFPTPHPAGIELDSGWEPAPVTPACPILLVAPIPSTWHETDGHSWMWGGWEGTSVGLPGCSMPRDTP